MHQRTERPARASTAANEGRQTPAQGMAGSDRNEWPTSVGAGGRLVSKSTQISLMPVWLLAGLPENCRLR
jgi:hypothetical protein